MTELIDSHDLLPEQQEGSLDTNSNNKSGMVTTTSATSSQSVQTNTTEPVAYYLVDQFSKAQSEMCVLRKQVTRLNRDIISLSSGQHRREKEIEALQIQLVKNKHENEKQIKELTHRIATLEKSVPLIAKRIVKSDGIVKCVML